MAYATLMHFMTQLSRWILSSLGEAPFVWQVRFGILAMCRLDGKSGFVSHTKYIAEAINMDLFYS